MQPYRLLYVAPVGEKGGMEVNLVGEMRQLDRSLFTPIVVCLQDGPLVEELRALGVAAYVVARGRLRNLPRALLTTMRLARLIRRLRVSLIISENWYAHLYARVAAAVVGRPAILRSGGVTHPLEWLERISFALGASAFVANSRFTQQALIDAGVPESRVAMIYRGVDISGFGDDGSGIALRASLGIPPDVPVLSVIGRLQASKGQHVAIRAAPQVIRAFPGTQFLIVGGALFGIEQEYPVHLRALVQELCLDQHVMMLGHRSDIRSILLASDVVLAPSIIPEGFGMVTVEAMAAGRPVIATNAGGPAEVVADGETGVLVSPNSPDMLARSIISLLSDGERRRAIGARAKEVVQARFTLDRAVREYQELYLKCLEA